MPPPLHAAQRGSLCIHLDLECLIIPHPNQRHYHFITATMDRLRLFSKVKMMSDTQLFLSLLVMIINQRLSAHKETVKNENMQSERSCCPLMEMCLQHPVEHIMMINCAKYSTQTKQKNPQKLSSGEFDVDGLTFISSCKVVCSCGLVLYSRCNLVCL